MTNLTREQKKELFEIEKEKRVAGIKEQMVLELKEIWRGHTDGDDFAHYEAWDITKDSIPSLLAAEAMEFKDD